MKRIIFGLAVIIVAGTMAAFTAPSMSKYNLEDAFFQFDIEQYQPTVANVEDESKWIRVLDMDDCSSGTAVACKIRVAEGFYLGTTLLSTVDIQAEESSLDVAFVIDAEALAIVNSAHP